VRVHVVAAPDKFKGTLAAREVAEAMARAVRSSGHTCEIVPMADGGEGFLDALGGPNRTSLVTGPLGDPVEAGWRLDRRLAVIEMATASGLALVGGAEGNDPVAASTYGTGELVATALESGANRVLVGVGGSATTDGGLGALRAIYPVHRLRGVQMQVACDVETKFVDAAEVFAPQKGASPAQVALLKRRLERLAQAYRDEYGVDVTAITGAGAAGGLAGGLAAVGAELVSGFELVADEMELFDRVEKADLVLTGEGFLDTESFAGKVVGGVASLGAEADVPVIAVVGEVFDDAGHRLDGVLELVERFGRERSMADPASCIEDAVAGYFASS
jgi:glycerate 2-kinase